MISPNGLACALVSLSILIKLHEGAASGGGTRRLQDADRQWGSLGELYCPPGDGCSDPENEGYAETLAFSGSGTRVVLGSPHATRGNNDAHTGFVRVLEHVAGSSIWNQVGGDIDGASGGDFFGRGVSIRADGTRIAAVAPGYDVAGEYYTDDGLIIGRLRVFDEVEGEWEEVGALSDVDAALMSADGTTFVVGRTEAAGTGSTGVFRLEGDGFRQIGAWIDTTVPADLFFDTAVAISDDGSRIAVGATLYDEEGFKKKSNEDDDIFYDDYVYDNFFPTCFNEKGKIDDTQANFGLVRAYEVVDGQWVQMGEDIVGDRPCDKFGASLDLSADGARLVVGAPESDVPYYKDDDYEEKAVYRISGSVRVLDYADGAWTDAGPPIRGVGRLTQLGTYVAISADGGRLVVGSANGWMSESTEYPVCVYEQTEEGWTTVGNCIQAALDDNCKGVAMDGTGSVVGIACSNMVKMNQRGGGARVFFQMDNCMEENNESRLQGVDLLADQTVRKKKKLGRRHDKAKGRIESMFDEKWAACDDRECKNNVDEQQWKKTKKLKNSFEVKAVKNMANFEKGEAKVTLQFVKNVKKLCD